MTRRIYRLGALLKHAGACKEWREFVAQFRTADEVFDAVNADPGADYSPRGLHYDGTIAWSVRWYGHKLACLIGTGDDVRWWSERAGFQPYRGATNASQDVRPVTREERARFLALWQRYADTHGLYEDVADEVAA